MRRGVSETARSAATIARIASTSRATNTMSGSKPAATHAYSLHTTGYAFDIARVYRSRAQALAFQWVLDRLAARGMIAWIREPQAIHVTVASR